MSDSSSQTSWPKGELRRHILRSYIHSDSSLQHLTTNFNVAFDTYQATSVMNSDDTGFPNVMSSRHGQPPGLSTSPLQQTINDDIEESLREVYNAAPSPAENNTISAEANVNTDWTVRKGAEGHLIPRSTQPKQKPPATNDNRATVNTPNAASDREPVVIDDDGTNSQQDQQSDDGTNVGSDAEDDENDENDEETQSQIAREEAETQALLDAQDESSEDEEEKERRTIREAKWAASTQLRADRAEFLAKTGIPFGTWRFKRKTKDENNWTLPDAIRVMK